MRDRKGFEMKAAMAVVVVAKRSGERGRMTRRDEEKKTRGMGEEKKNRKKKVALDPEVG
jgi:hypothetical protein